MNWSSSMSVMAALEAAIRVDYLTRVTADDFQIRRQASGCRPSPVNPVFLVGFSMPAVIVDVQVLTGGCQ